MASFSPVKDAFSRLGTQWSLYRSLVAVRGFRTRSHFYHADARHPNWQLLTVLAVSLMLGCMLFLDEPAGFWKSQVPPRVYAFFHDYTDLGKSDVILIPAGIILLGLALAPWHRLGMKARVVLTHFQLLGLFAFVAVAGAGLSNNLFKIIIGRARPRNFDELGAFHLAPPGWSSGFQSFPSGHSVTAGAMAIIFILVFPKLKWTWLGLVAWIGISRVIVGAHFPSDVVVGLSYGMAFTWLLALWFANRRLLFRTENGLIRIPAYSGLSLSKLYKALHMMGQKA